MLFDPCDASKVRLPFPTAAILTLALVSAPVHAQRSIAYLADRGEGIATSMFGEYVRAGEYVFYPFYEYTRFHEFEYKPAELGYGVDQDFRGKFVEHEANS